MKIINSLLLLVLWLGGVDVMADASPFAGANRTPEFVARDSYRHPVETLAFFQVEPGMTVVEISPGAGCIPKFSRHWSNTGTLIKACCMRPIFQKTAVCPITNGRWRHLPRSWPLIRRRMAM